VQTAKLVKLAGANSVAVIGAITKAKDFEAITQQLLESMG
jgi:thiamine monophosphate synthase